MEIKDKIYFNNFTNYKPRISKAVYPEVQEEIDFISVKIRNLAKEALNEQISSNNVKKEISDLLNNINELKKEVI